MLLQVDEVKSDEVICTSRNSAQLDGLLTVFHTERSADTLQNIQNDLPILTEYDKKVIKAISKELEIDFLSLSFVREGEDLTVAREFLESIGATTTKVGPTPHSPPPCACPSMHAQCEVLAVTLVCRGPPAGHPSSPRCGGPLWPSCHVAAVFSGATSNFHTCAACSAQLAAKCETRQSLFNFQAITEAADAIIMSRGNLGLDVLPEKMALAQKAVISNCNLLGKPVLITRVVDTMVNAPRPTRCVPLKGQHYTQRDVSFLQPLLPPVVLLLEQDHGRMVL